MRPVLNKTFLLALLLCAQLHNAAAADSLRRRVYNVHYIPELSASVAFLSLSYFGFRELDRHASLSADQVLQLNTNNINAFDRPVALQNPSGFDKAHQTSNVLLNIAIASPAVLLLDKKVRRDFPDFITMFLLSHSVDNALYFATSFSVRRARPLTYNAGLPLEARVGEAKSNSFFSGHVSFSATSTFFLAKIYTDYHHIKGWQRLLFYTGAAVPPALVGYYRMRAGKHFKTDVLTGLIVGAASGIMVPELHRRRHQGGKLSLSPFYYEGYNGLTLSFNLR